MVILYWVAASVAALFALVTYLHARRIGPAGIAMFLSLWPVWLGMAVVLIPWGFFLYV